MFLKKFIGLIFISGEENQDVNWWYTSTARVYKQNMYMILDVIKSKKTKPRIIETKETIQVMSAIVTTIKKQT